MSRGQDLPRIPENDNSTVIMVEKFDFRFTPWSGTDELISVRNLIYDSIMIEDNAINSFKRKFTNNTSDHNLNLAHDRISDWKVRCSNIPQSQLIQEHLFLMDSLINILLEEFKLQISSNFIPEQSYSSLLYSLYSMGVINICKVLESYSKEKQTVSTKNLAKILNCPQWIVDCRNDLSHSCPHPPSMHILFNAISFGLKWQEENFWNKLIHYELRRTVEPMPNANLEHRTNQELCDRNKVFKDSCFMLFAPSLGRRATYIVKLIQRYMNHNPNTYIGILVQILILDVPKYQLIEPPKKLSQPQLSSPISDLMAMRAAKLFKIIFSVVPEHSLGVFFNLMIDLILDLQQPKSNRLNSMLTMEERMKSIRIGYAWLAKILWSLVKPKNETSRLLTHLDRAFSVFNNLERLKNENQLVWNRMFYKILKLHPNSLLIQIVKMFYQNLIFEHSFARKQYEHVINLMRIFVENSSLDCQPNENHENFNYMANLNVHTVKDILPNEPLRMMPAVEDDGQWDRIFIGANAG